MVFNRQTVADYETLVRHIESGVKHHINRSTVKEINLAIMVLAIY